MKLALRFGMLVFDRFNNILSILGAILLVVLSITVGLNAITRVYGFYILGLLDIARFCLVWLAFMGAAWLLRTDGHIAINVVTSQMRPKAGALLDMATGIVTLLTFALFTWSLIKLALFHIQNRYIITDSLFHPLKFPIEVIIPLGCFLLVIELFRKVYTRWMDWKTR